MIVLANEQMIIDALTSPNQKILPLSNMRKPNYPGVQFECGCGSNHSATDTLYFLCGNFNEFFYHCPLEFVTLVKFRGFFKAKAETRWSCEYRLYNLACARLRE